MNILVIGSGGREHAVIKALYSEEHKLYCSPGNAGIEQLSEIIPLDLKNHQSVVTFCQQKNIGLVFIGPEDPLVDGLSDSLREMQIPVFGPSKAAAKLEGSKIFAKEFMLEAGVPTAKAQVVSSVAETLEAAIHFTPPFILKADGLAAGKGVFICADKEELKQAAEGIFERKILGDAGTTALLEQNLPGKEISFLVLTNGEDFQALPLAQDHKRLLNENKGPNTGGMGTVAPMHIDSGLYSEIIETVIKPTVAHIKKTNLLYRGVVFVGLMVVNNKPFVLEYNVRFGDPETQVILPLIENNLFSVFKNLSEGYLETLKFKPQSVFCIVNAAPGYPDKAQRNIPIELPKDNIDTYILHAGTLKSPTGLVSNGGRVLNIVSVADKTTEAKLNAYEHNSKVKFEGRQFRTDIGDYV